MSELTSGASRKQLYVYAIIERKDSSKPAYWMRVGTAFANRDGSLSLVLDALPIGSNKLHIREPRPWDEERHGSGRRDGPSAEVHP